MENNKTALQPIQINKVDFSLLDEKTQYLCDHKQQGQGLHFPSAIKKYSKSFTHVYLPVSSLSKVGEVTDEQIEEAMEEYLGWLGQYDISTTENDIKLLLRSLLHPQPVNSEGNGNEVHRKSLEALDRYLAETPKEEIEKVIAEIDKLNIQGPTFQEYLNSFSVSSEGKKEKEHSTTIIPGHENLNADRLYAPYNSVEQGEAKEPTDDEINNILRSNWRGELSYKGCEQIRSLFRSSEIKEQITDEQAKVISLDFAKELCKGHSVSDNRLVEVATVYYKGIMLGRSLQVKSNEQTKTV